MATALASPKMGPSDHGRSVTAEEFDAARFEPGYKYELIDGRVYVTYEADPPEDWTEKWIFAKLWRYATKHPKVINYVTDKARVFLPPQYRVTIPEPDLAAYHNFPARPPLRRLRWQNLNPILVGEILSANDPHKDLIRNVQLYLLVPSIREYWVIDARDDADRPTMHVYRRHGQRWRIRELAFGDTCRTNLLPGFRLVINPYR